MSSIDYVIHEINICNNTHQPMSMSFHLKIKLCEKFEATQHKIDLSNLTFMQMLHLLMHTEIAENQQMICINIFVYNFVSGCDQCVARITFPLCFSVYSLNLNVNVITHLICSIHRNAGAQIQQQHENKTFKQLNK